jgi:hypothetical protein
MIEYDEKGMSANTILAMPTPSNTLSVDSWQNQDSKLIQLLLFFFFNTPHLISSSQLIFEIFFQFFKIQVQRQLYRLELEHRHHHQLRGQRRKRNRHDPTIQSWTLTEDKLVH